MLHGLMLQSLWLRGLVIPPPRWLVLLLVRCLQMARVVAQLGCDRGLHQHVPLRAQSVPVVGGVNALVDTAM